MCKYQNITGTLGLTIVFGIHYNFMIVLSVWLKICRSNEFFFFTRQNAKTSEVLGAQFIQAWCWSLFSTKLQSFRLPILLKRGSNTGVFLWNCEVFKKTYFEEHLRTAVSGCNLSFFWCSSQNTNFIEFQRNSSNPAVQ